MKESSPAKCSNNRRRSSESTDFGRWCWKLASRYLSMSSYWPKLRAVTDWLGRFMALLRNQKYERDSPDPALRAKEALASYRGQTCGVRYAEAVWAMSPAPRDIL